jgi:hypothetical protein
VSFDTGTFTGTRLKELAYFGSRDFQHKDGRWWMKIEAKSS